MPEAPLVGEILTQIDQALTTIEERFVPVKTADDLLDTPEGQEKLDGLCMLFIAIGESLKKIDKLTDGRLLERHKHIDWKGIKGMRDILSHHYFDLNAEAIYIACDEEVPPLHTAIKDMLQSP